MFTNTAAGLEGCEMNPLVHYRALVTTLLLQGTIFATAQGEEFRRPNVILMMTDEQGYGDLSCHRNPVLRTPHLDRLAAEGIEFTQFYCCANCSPTRASLMTGRYNYRTGVTEVSRGRHLMYADEVTIAELLRAAGYRTGIFGKWHLGDCPPMRPSDQGFEESLVHKGGGIGQAAGPPGNTYFDPILEHNNRPKRFGGYCDDIFTDAAIDFIERHREGPFLIINGAYSWHTWRQLEQRLAGLRAAGEPTKFAELAPTPIPPQQDADAHLHRLTPRLKAFEREYVEFLDRTSLGKSFSEREEQGKPPTSDQIMAIREIMSHYPELPQALDEASRCEGYASRIDYAVADSLVLEEVMSTANSRRMPARFLRWKITVLLSDGQQDEALRMGMVILRLARHYDGEPALVNGLVACAVRDAAVDSLNLVLCSGSLSAQVRQELDQELALHDDPAWIQHVMTTERVINLSASRGQFSQAWWLPWYERGLEIDIIDFHQRLLPAISQPWNKARDDIRNINRGVSSYSSPVSGTLLTLLEPAVEAACVSFNRSTAMLRCLRIRNKLAAYAQDNGHEAEGIDDVDLPTAAKVDPFSGQPLRLKWTDDGWVVYTVFKNGTDDDGNFIDQADWGLGPVGYVP